ncbi:hypothetical protein BKA82DRAFT_2320502 [Pisolithus tinctorius]|nr:hypothetical protein BKA82DRAFT_2320502 [Pisolithus tinctorius]
MWKALSQAWLFFPQVPLPTATIGRQVRSPRITCTGFSCFDHRKGSSISLINHYVVPRQLRDSESRIGPLARGVVARLEAAVHPGCVQCFRIQSSPGRNLSSDLVCRYDTANRG